MIPKIITDANFTTTAIGVADRAQSSLLIVQYLFVLDRTASHPAPRIAAALMEAAERGVQVRILLNHFSHGRAASRSGLHRPVELSHHNIDLRWHTRGQVLHAKVIVGDNREVLVGSHNLSQWCLTRSHNLSILTNDTTTGPAVLAVYDPMFARAKHA